ncbi:MULTISPECIES: hypothetical protein [Rhodobacterales]|jgi:hypothetical protein|uniref:Peptidase M23 n=1 Tax=Phaeobacter gallaeciensis TaxID=60890 RepID=A0A1B0ZTA1_9RHOB|nr:MULTISPECIES: hypothetical protein [Phaeobacter]MDF1773617.1 hypothetical protein [Pseudophaeobacter sp. bin_em_oilr2.035]MEE2633274.1 hypothetical protein [Pseudomonadota bacterium]ANP37427.1 hypothetical protein JL2886_02538 [Phaeobacter gallaeciensis]MDE4059636.1 hypothetical protein [Phaeobacter gallaeciensis]MDE4098228.1 hypothetical protein [Phaeobacter gallaeciensis]
MKHLPALASAIALTAGPALAHGGAHLHPHGSESWLPVILAALTVGGAAALAYVRSRK